MLAVSNDACVMGLPHLLVRNKQPINQLAKYIKSRQARRYEALKDNESRMCCVSDALTRQRDYVLETDAG